VEKAPLTGTKITWPLVGVTTGEYKCRVLRCLTVPNANSKSRFR